jgi:tetratricopeptide (TPR) repeat protein
LLNESLVGGQSLRETAAPIRMEANKALALDPSDASPHYLLGSVAAAHDYDWTAAREHFEIAVAAENAPAEAHWAYASLYLQALGRFEDAVSHMERAVGRDPLNPHWRAVLGSHLVHLGNHTGNAEQYERALREANEAIRLDATHPHGYAIVGQAYMAMERWSDAIAALEHAYRLTPTFALATGWLAAAHARGGERERAAQLLRVLDDPRPPIGRVLYHLVVDELDLAAEWMRRAIEYRDPFAIVMAAEKTMCPLRQSAHWPPLAALMNLPPLP